MGKFGWCFIGSGNITERVMKDLPRTRGGYLAAVYSRNFENTRKFAEKYGAVACKTAEEAMGAPGVQAIYVATPHPFHWDYTLLALKQSKPVLCEKPLAMNLAEAREMVTAARENGTYLLDGLWTRHNPVIKQVLSWVKEGRIGRVRSLQASFLFYSPFNPASRLFAPELGGGALLDVGVYVIALARFLFGTNPVSVSADADFSSLGVDVLCAMQFKYGDGAIARLFGGIGASEPQDACIAGEMGYIHVPVFWSPKSASLCTKQGTERFEPGFPGEGFQFQFDAAADDILAGKKENDLVDHRTSLDIMEVIETVKEKIQRKEVKYD
jgi:predicted dehydrogenase